MKDDILQFLEDRCEPASTEKIREHTGNGNWNTVLKHCLELYIDGSIEALKSDRGWIFWRGDSGDE